MQTLKNKALTYLEGKGGQANIIRNKLLPWKHNKPDSKRKHFF